MDGIGNGSICIILQVQGEIKKRYYRFQLQRTGGGLRSSNRSHSGTTMTYFTRAGRNSLYSTNSTVLDKGESIYLPTRTKNGDHNNFGNNYLKASHDPKLANDMNGRQQEMTNERGRLLCESVGPDGLMCNSDDKTIQIEKAYLKESVM